MGDAAQAYMYGLGLYNAGDLDGYVLQFHPDAILTRPDRSAHGRDAIRQLWAKELATFPDRSLSVDLLLERDDLVMTEWTWVGTSAGPSSVESMGTALTSVHRVEVKGMEVTRLRDALIMEYRMYWDRVDVQEQLGL